VFLPASQLPARAAPVEAVDSVTRPKARSGRILVVDDEEQLRAALQRYLSRKHHVLTAASGKQAQDLLERDGEFDIVICDLMMREGSGMDLFEWLEEHRPMLTERMLFVTGGGVTPQARAFIDRHEERVVAKPIKIPHLMAQIRALLA